MFGTREGRKYIDLTAAFGVAAAGHGQMRVVAAGQRQMATLLHAMGDVHPHALKAELARELSRITFERWSSGKMSGKTMFANSGFEAIEAALKTAMLATGKRGILAFTDAYHGLGYGALNATHRAYFREPFRSQLGKFGRFIPFPREGEDLAGTRKWIITLLRSKQFGAILVEPIQGRGGVNVPSRGFLPLLRTLCNQYGVLLIVDEIFTGFGRTGTWFACEHSRTTPDLICLGKALTGGFPLSGCVGQAKCGGRMAAFQWRGHPYQHLSRTSGRLRHGPGANQGNRKSIAPATKRHNGRISAAKAADGNYRARAFHRSSWSRFDGWLGDQKSRWQAGYRIGFGSSQADVAPRFYSPARRRVWERDQFQPAANNHQGPDCGNGGGLAGGLAVKLSEIKQVLSERELTLTKSLGQNFLHDQNQLRRIVAAAEVGPYRQGSGNRPGAWSTDGTPFGKSGRGLCD